MCFIPIIFLQRSLYMAILSKLLRSLNYVILKIALLISYMKEDRNVKTSIVIAEHDPQSCQIIANAIKSSREDFKITHIVNSGTGLLRLLQESSPDIVMIDALLPETDVFSLIKNCGGDKNPDCRFVVIGGPDFKLIHRGVKLGIQDYLVKPLDERELNECIAKFSNVTSHRFYIDDKGILEAFKKQSLSLNEFNRIYGTRFCDGLFQMLLTRFDAPAKFAGFFTHDPTQTAWINEDITSYFTDICADMIIDKKSDSSIILLNYPAEVRSFVDHRIREELYPYLTRTDRSMELTICVSDTISDLYHVWELKEQVRDLEWSRMRKEKRHVILWNPLEGQVPLETREWLQQTFINIRIAFETLDVTGFMRLIDEIYALPQELLITNELRVFIKQVLALLFDIYGDSIAEFAEPTQLQLKITFSLRCCTTFQSHRNSLVSQCTDLMNKIASCIEKQYSPAVMQAIIAVKHNLDKKITLENVASMVHLNTSYFSYLFHKEIGQSFTKYVNEQKNKFACELLKETSLNISEAAYRTGFPSVQTFSKFFKGINGITPSQYRQLYQNEE